MGGQVVRTRWAAIGAAVAVTLGGGAFGVVRATVSSGDRASYFPITPTRVLDTRNTTELTNGTLRLTVEGQIDLVDEVIDRTVVPTDATAVAVNLTVTGGRKNGNYGYVTAYPCTSTADPAPNASSLNFENGVDIANALNITTSTNGSICLYVYGTADLIIDIAGYYADHDHDDRYYTKAQTDTALSGKSDILDLLPLRPNGAPSIIDDNQRLIDFSSMDIGSNGLPMFSYFSMEDGLVFATCLDRECESVLRNSVDSTNGSGSESSIVRGADGNPVISYLDDANFDLNLAVCDDPLCLTSTATTIDQADSVGWASSIAIGVDGHPIIAYHDRTNMSLKFADCMNRLCSSKTVRTIASMGFMSNPNISLAVGVDGNPIMAFTDGNAFDLKVAACLDPSCSSNSIRTIESSGDVGFYPAIAIGFTGHPIIGYRDSTRGTLTVAVCDDPTCSTWTTSIVDSDGDVGHNIAIAIAPNGLPLLSYYEFGSPFKVKVASCTDVKCSSSTRTTVTETASFSWNTSLAVGADGTPYVAFIDGSLMDGDLEVAPLWWMTGGR
jgi:hypothetical protein